MKKNKIFIACDSTNISKVKRIIQDTQNKKIKIPKMQKNQNPKRYFH